MNTMRIISEVLEFNSVKYDINSVASIQSFLQILMMTKERVVSNPVITPIFLLLKSSICQCQSYAKEKHNETQSMIVP